MQRRRHNFDATPQCALPFNLQVLDSARRLQNQRGRTNKKPRDEAQIFDELATLTASPGYVHAIARMCNRDNIIYIKDKLKPSDMNRLFSRERLIRTELTTLIGVMAKNPLDLTQQPTHVIEDYVQR